MAGLLVVACGVKAVPSPTPDQPVDLVISLQQDGRFLEALLRQAGIEWLQQRLGDAFIRFGGRAAEGEISSDFLAQYRATLKAPVDTLTSSDSRARLKAIIKRAADTAKSLPPVKGEG